MNLEFFVSRSHLFMALCVVGFISLSTPAARANGYTVTYAISGTFSDGTTMSGTLTYDSSCGLYPGCTAALYNGPNSGGGISSWDITLTFFPSPGSDDLVPAQYCTDEQFSSQFGIINLSYGLTCGSSGFESANNGFLNLYLPIYGDNYSSLPTQSYTLCSLTYDPASCYLVSNYGVNTVDPGLTSGAISPVTTSTPEPSSLLLLGTGLLGLGPFIRRRLAS